MESASNLIDLTLPVASSAETSRTSDRMASSPSHRRQSSMASPVLTGTRHNENSDGGGSPSDGQLRRDGVGTIEHGETVAGQGTPSARSQREEGRALLLPSDADSAAVDAAAAAVDDAATAEASSLGENVASESSGERQTAPVARRGHGCHAPLSRVVGGQTGAVG